MDQKGECQLSPDKLPKSVKVRSTCNACQQAKIRCSHERPACRRCQRHNIHCIYSISRRLGRPAKKRENAPDASAAGQETGDHSGNQSNKRIRSPRKKKVKDEPTNNAETKESHEDPEEQLEIDRASFDNGLMDDISVEETSAFMDIKTVAPFSDNIDLTSDSWLQEFMSNTFPDMNQQCNPPDPVEAVGSKPDDMKSSVCMGLKDFPTSSESFSGSSSEALNQACSFPSHYPGMGNYLPHVEPAIGISQSAIEGSSTYPEFLTRESLAWSQPFSSLVEDLPCESSSLFSQTKPVKRTCEYNFPVDSFGANSNTGIPSHCQCQSHEQAVRDLIRVNICASRTGSSIAIDSILTCQRVLQQLAETILQCRICSRTRVNLLMVVIVSIDSLITTLDAITSTESDIVDRCFPEYSNQLLQDYRHEPSLSTQHSRRYKGNGIQFRAQLDSCPLVIGGFCVPSEDKFSFVKRVLHTRLSGLLGTVRRIRICTQEVLAASASRGRLIMIMETDRRLQLIMMKMKMLTRA